MDYKNLSTEELFKIISPSSPPRQELKKRGVIRTANIVGEIGEFYTKKFFNKIDKKIYTTTKKLPNLTLAAPGTKNVDALGRDGKIYSIKCIAGKNRTTGSFWYPDKIRNNIKTFDYLIILMLDFEYVVDKILELSWDDFSKYKKYNKTMNNFQISVTNKMIDEYKIVYKKWPFDW